MRRIRVSASDCAPPSLAPLEGKKGEDGARVRVTVMVACAAAGFCGLAGPWRDRLAPLVPTGQHEPDLRSGKTKYASIYRFKGLESRAVVLTDIDRLETAHERDLFYIGATRATQRLIVLAQEKLGGRLKRALR